MPVRQQISSRPLRAKPGISDLRNADGLAQSAPHPSSTDPYNPSAEATAAVLEALQRGTLIDVNGTVEVWDIGEDRIVKRGARVSMAEATVMEYVRKSTTIPVPKVRMVFSHNDVVHIVMDHIEGTLLERSESVSSDEELESLAGQLAGYVNQLRALPSTELMGSWPAGSYSNLLFDPPPRNDFKFIEEFNLYWKRRMMVFDRFAEVPETLKKAGLASPIVFSHGDLAPRNIIVKDSKIAAVLDWETAGWYPEVWDLCMAWRGSSHLPRLEKVICKALGGPNEIWKDYRRVLDYVFVRSH